MRPTSEKVITVADIDPLMPCYKVIGAREQELGKKVGASKYIKPRYDKYGRRIGGKYSTYEDRMYKVTPPWFKLRVVEIKKVGCDIGVYVEEG